MSTLLNIAGLIAVGIMSGATTAICVRAGQRGKPWWPELWFGLHMVLCVIFAALNLVWHDYGWMIGFIVLAILNGRNWWDWHKRRRKKRPMGSLLGAKARRIRDSLVKKQREATVPTN